jgi:hypothetical protein
MVKLLSIRTDAEIRGISLGASTALLPEYGELGTSGGKSKGKCIRGIETMLPSHYLLHFAEGPALLDVQPYDFLAELLPWLCHCVNEEGELVCLWQR